MDEELKEEQKDAQRWERPTCEKGKRGGAHVTVYTPLMQTWLCGF